MLLFGHDTSPYVRRSRVLLAELGVAFERDASHWKTPSPELARRNPLMRVPALLDERSGGTQVLLDSSLIARYLYDIAPSLDRRPPSPAAGELPPQPTLFRPDHTYDDENLLRGIDAALDSAINVFVLGLDGITPAVSPYLDRQRQRVGSCLTWLDGVIDGRDSVSGAHFAYLDIALACLLEWLSFRKLGDVDAHPNLARFARTHAPRRSLADTRPA